MRILVVEDEADLNLLLRKVLTKAGYTVDGCMDGEDAMDHLLGAEYDAVLLDIMLPKKDGHAVVREMRARGMDTPVLFLTARDSVADRICGLDLGADDYLVKPFGVMEMVSRVKAVLRRCRKQQEKHLLTLGELVLNQQAHTVSIGEERLPLTFKEYELLRLFLQNPGVAFTREQLLSSVWDADYLGETRTVDMHIRTLRQKLGDYGKRIETVRNVGYRWEAGHDQ